MTAHAVRQSFNRAAAAYALTASFQQQVAEQLVRDISDKLPRNFSGLLLDAGCGTGDCLTQLGVHYPAATLIGVDFAESMLQSWPLGKAPHRINADLQQLPFADHCIDLYVSSLAWQWCDLEASIAEASRILHYGGKLWLTTLVSGTFHELASSLAEAGLTPQAHLLPLSDHHLVLRAFQQSTLQVHAAKCDAITTYHPSFEDLRHSIRGIGANHLPLPSTEPFNRLGRRRLVDALESRRTSRGLPLTYHVLSIHAQRISLTDEQ